MSTEESSPEPLKLSCSTSDCENELHCFRESKRLASAYPHGACQACGAQLIDWDRLHTRSLDDVDGTFAALRNEWVRHHFWEAPFDQHAINHALRAGRTRLEERVQARITAALAPAEPFRDGSQTPFSGQVVYYGQHATAACCRKCVEYWHGIPRGRPLAAQEITYLSRLVSLFVDLRLPDLPRDGQYVPPIRRTANNGGSDG